MIKKRYLLLILTILYTFPLVHFEAKIRSPYIVDHQYLPHASSFTNQSVDYLIITDSEFEAVIEPLAIWKTQKGLTTLMITVDDIKSRFSGRNIPEQIKNCITYYYNNNQTVWVLLAGDHEHIPSQNFAFYENFTD